MLTSNRQVTAQHSPKEFKILLVCIKNGKEKLYTKQEAKELIKNKTHKVKTY